MTAVRLRSQDAKTRAIEVHRLNTEEHWTVKQLAEHYEATERAVYDWLKLGRKLALPDMDDKTAWFQLILQDQGARLDGSKDTDSVAISKNLQQLLGVGSAEELKQHMARLETEKVALVARAFDQAIDGLPGDRHVLRSRFLDALDELESP